VPVVGLMKVADWRRQSRDSWLAGINHSCVIAAPYLAVLDLMHALAQF